LHLLSLSTCLGNSLSISCILSQKQPFVSLNLCIFEIFISLISVLILVNVFLLIWGLLVLVYLRCWVPSLDLR
jgi:hypothetical protein